jgi:hypothetical protein
VISFSNRLLAEVRDKARDKRQEEMILRITSAEGRFFNVTSGSGDLGMTSTKALTDKS